MRHWMMDCREISRMVSASMDRKLPLYQRIGIRMHVLMCRYCYRYRKQLLLLRKVIHLNVNLSQKISSEIHLPEAARTRIIERLNRQLAGR